MLKTCYDRICIAQNAQYLSANDLVRNRLWMVGATIVLSTLIGTSVLADLQKPFTPELDPWIQDMLGLLSIAAAALAIFQSILTG